MKQLGASRLVTWLCLAAYLLGGAFYGKGLVLCVEPDGCIALEAAHASACVGCDDAHAPPSREREAQGSPRCGCVDITIPVARDDVNPQKRGEERGRVPPPVVVAAVPHAASDVATTRDPQPSLVPRAPPCRPPALLALVRSVVLLL